ncbi:hypothetical protein Salat_2129700 [Sesamum alatum]|uniref:Uncharacterized protein n=1 Tax=Sesamum alatum TaxID=300844 RepID=A0AAE2CGW2_9LAMI|nr:hypothetical protein Salat_2129700 [Sesamum alatum]
MCGWGRGVFAFVSVRERRIGGCVVAKADRACSGVYRLRQIPNRHRNQAQVSSEGQPSSRSSPGQGKRPRRNRRIGGRRTEQGSMLRRPRVSVLGGLSDKLV